jgi:signal peptidase II
MKKSLTFFFLSLTTIFLIDQYIKTIFINGFRYEGSSISLILVYNKGVAFSMFSFLKEYLKYLQLLLITAIGIFLYKEKLMQIHPIISGILIGAGLSNIFDRFIREGVVDYIYYHGLFNFAVFNFADVMIDFSIGMFLFYYFFKENEKKGYLKNR